MLATDHALTVHLIEIIPVLLISFISFIGLGLLFGAKLVKHKKLSSYFLVIFAYVFAALLGYVDFYIYLGSVRVGADIGLALIVLNILGVAYVFGDRNLRKVILHCILVF